MFCVLIEFSQKPMGLDADLIDIGFVAAAKTETMLSAQRRPVNVL